MLEDGKNIPYQKTVVTLSILVLIFCYGQGELKSSLSIALVGVELHKPAILQLFIYAGLIWSTWRFYVSNSWRARHLGVRTIQGNLAREPNSNHWELISYTGPLTPEQIRQFPNRNAVISNYDVDGLFSRYFKIFYRLQNQLDDAQHEVVLKVPFLIRIKVEISALRHWVLREDAFAQLYLPMWFAMAAITRGACKVLFGD